jgi:hypothetical protein
MVKVSLCVCLKGMRFEEKNGEVRFLRFHTSGKRFSRRGITSLLRINTSRRRISYTLSPYKGVPIICVSYISFKNQSNKSIKSINLKCKCTHMFPLSYENEVKVKILSERVWNQRESEDEHLITHSFNADKDFEFIIILMSLTSSNTPYINIERMCTFTLIVTFFSFLLCLKSFKGYYTIPEREENRPREC